MTSGLLDWLSKLGSQGWLGVASQPAGQPAGQPASNICGNNPENKWQFQASVPKTLSKEGPEVGPASMRVLCLTPSNPSCCSHGPQGCSQRCQNGPPEYQNGSTKPPNGNREELTKMGRRRTPSYTHRYITYIHHFENPCNVLLFMGGYPGVDAHEGIPVRGDVSKHPNTQTPKHTNT